MDHDRQEPPLPPARGPVSAAVQEYLLGAGPLPRHETVAGADVYGDDLQLALYICYELHYRGFSGVSSDHEWDPGLLRTRAVLEHRFLSALRTDTPVHDSVEDALAGLLVEPVDGTGLSHFLSKEGELWHVREYAAQRSLYHLKEADPHAWVLPRLWGRAKAGMAAVEFDEFGGGRPDRVHARLFADLMTDLGLDTTYGYYLEAACAEMLATVNLMSLLGLHRSLRGALVGHFAAVEITSSPAPGDSPRRCAAPARDRPPSISTTSTSRPTPSTNRSYATRSSAVCWPRNRISPPTSPSASTSPDLSRTVSPSAFCTTGRTDVRRCAHPRFPKSTIFPECRGTWAA